MTKHQEKENLGSWKQRSIQGEKFLIALYRLTTASKIYQSNNEILLESAKEFLGITTKWVSEEGILTLEVARGQFFLDDEKLSFQRENIKVIKEMLDYFEHRMNPGLRFNSDINSTPLEQVLAFAQLLNNAVNEEDPLLWLDKQLAEVSFPWVEIVYLPELIQEVHGEEQKEMARKTYSYALSSVKELSQKIAAQNRAGVRKVKRIVQNMVDLLLEDDSLLLGMSTIREYDDYTYTHSVNVAILSLCLGRQIGLLKDSLSWLGISALVHDLGKLDVPQEILNKPGKLTKNEFQEIERHPLRSVTQVLKLLASRDLKAKILLPPLEHHMKYDFSGYPRVRRKKPISLFGRIIAIADVFDALSSPRIYRPMAHSPDKALAFMMENAGKDFDPILLKVFINMLGLYPVGTLVYLNTGEKGLVVSYSENNNKTRPLIVLLESDNQGGFQKGKFVSLAEKDPKTGSFLRSIKGTNHPAALGIQPVEFIC